MNHRSSQTRPVASDRHDSHSVFQGGDRQATTHLSPPSTIEGLSPIVSSIPPCRSALSGLPHVLLARVLLPHRHPALGHDTPRHNSDSHRNKRDLDARDEHHDRHLPGWGTTPAIHLVRDIRIAHSESTKEGRAEGPKTASTQELPSYSHHT